MTKISTVEARDQFAEVVNRAAYGKERIVLTRRGKELAAVVPIEDLASLEKLEDRLDLEAARRAWAEQGKKPPASWKKAKKRLGLK
jgi:prevent-host-death family protein